MVSLWTYVDFATCVRCAHSAKTDSFDPVEVRIHGPFSLWWISFVPRDGKRMPDNYCLHMRVIS